MKPLDGAAARLADLHELVVVAEGNAHGLDTAGDSRRPLLVEVFRGTGNGSKDVVQPDVLLPDFPGKGKQTEANVTDTRFSFEPESVKTGWQRLI